MGLGLFSDAEPERGRVSPIVDKSCDSLTGSGTFAFLTVGVRVIFGVSEGYGRLIKPGCPNDCSMFSMQQDIEGP
jgi:hypothetical protein